MFKYNFSFVLKIGETLLFDKVFLGGVPKDSSFKDKLASKMCGHKPSNISAFMRHLISAIDEKKNHTKAIQFFEKSNLG